MGRRRNSLPCTGFLILATIDCIAGIDPSRLQKVQAWPENNRTLREISCETTQYFHNGLCCQRCPAGTHVAQHCKSPGGQSSCQPCESGDYVDFNNGLERCLRCKSCREDEESVQICTSTSKSVCQCKLGYFCQQNEPCESCDKCTERCPKAMVIVQNCSATSDTVCGMDPAPAGGSFEGTTAAVSPHRDLASRKTGVGIYLLFLLILIFLILICAYLCYLYYQRRRKKELCFGNMNQSEEKESTAASVQSLVAPLLTEASVAVITERDHSTPIATTRSSMSKPSLLQSRQYIPRCQSDVPPRNKSSSAAECTVNLGATNAKEENCNDFENEEEPVDTTILPSQNEHPTGEIAEHSSNWDMRADIGLSLDDIPAVFNTFINEVPIKEWRNFMRILCLDENSIDAAVLDNPNNVKEQNYTMLLKWKNIFGKEATLNKLMLGVCEMKLKACYENIENDLTQKGILIRHDSKVMDNMH